MTRFDPEKAQMPPPAAPNAQACSGPQGAEPGDTNTLTDLYAPVTATAYVPAPQRAAHEHHVPLCSFGPGGAYVVDWRVLGQDLADGRRVFPPRTLVSALQRFATWVAVDIKGWLIASHPGRKYRADTAPAVFEPCPSCGHGSLWPAWFVAGQNAPAADQVAELHLAEAPASDAGTEPAATEAAQATQATGGDDEAPWPYLFRFSEEIEPVRDFKNSSAGALLARITPEGFSAEAGDARRTETQASNTEYSHDPHTQAATDSDRHSGLPRAQRLLADHAGTGRPARRVKGHHLRARRGAGEQGPHPADPQQGSLFGDCAGDQAA